MGQSPPAPEGAATKKREKLRLYKGTKLLAELSVSQKRIVVGSAPDAKIRLKKKGLPAEILILDATTRPVVIESRLPADKVFLNGWAVSRGFFRPGDKIEFLGLTLEMVSVEAKASKSAAAQKKSRQQPPQAPQDNTRPEAAVAARQSMARARGKPEPQKRKRQMPPVTAQASTDLTGTGPVPAQAGTQSQVQLTDFTMPESPAAPAENPFEAQMAEQPANENSESRELNPAWDGTTGDLESAIAAAEAEIAKIRGPEPEIEIEEIPPPQAPAPPREATNAAANDLLDQLLAEPDNTGEMPLLFEPDLEEIVEQKKAKPPQPREDPLRGRTRQRPEPTTNRRQPPPAVARQQKRTTPPETERPTVQDRPPVEPMPDPFVPQQRQAPTLGENEQNPFAQQARQQAQGPVKRDPTLRELVLDEGSVDLELQTPPPAAGAKTRVTEVPPGMADDLRARQPQTPRRPTPTPPDRPLPKPRQGQRSVRPRQRPPQEPVFTTDYRRRSPLRGVMVAMVVILLLGGTAFGVWRLGLAPQVTELAQGGNPSNGSGNNTSVKTNNGTTKTRTVNRNTNRNNTTGTRIARADNTRRGNDDGGGAGSMDDNEVFDSPIDGREGVKSILGDNRLNTNTNVDVSGLDASGGGNRLRAAREMDASELASIFVDAERPVVRKYYPELWDPAENYGAGSSAELEEGRAQIDTNRVNAKIRAKYPAIKACLAKSTGFRGGSARVVVNFTIYPNGRVSEVSIPSSDVSGSAFRSCVVRTISTIKFPRPKDSSVVVIYPFVFTRN